ncbi:integrase, catalytic region, zinc finger, CCHC-type containing protein [Tanacetum coccineum]
MQEEEGLGDKELAHYETDIKLNNILMYGLSNDIYNSIDSNQTSKESWNALKRTQQGVDIGVHTQQTLTLWNYQSFKAKPRRINWRIIPNQNLIKIDIINVFNLLKHNQEEVDDIKEEIKKMDKKETHSQIQTRDPLAFLEVTNFLQEESDSTSQELASILQNIALLDYLPRNKVVRQGGIRLERDVMGKEIAIGDATCYNCEKQGHYSRNCPSGKHAGVTEALADDAQLNEAFINKVHYDTDYDSSSDQDRLIHGTTSIFYHMAHIDTGSLDRTYDNSQVHHELVDYVHSTFKASI